MPKISISNKLVSANSSVNTQTSTATGVTRLSNLPTNIIADPTVPTTVTTNIKQESVSDATLARLAKVASSALAPANQLGTALPLGYKFNLPPHDWSLPLRPATVDPDLVGTTNDSSFHGLRRGRIWYWAGANNLTTNTSTTTTNSGYETPSSSSAPLNLIDTTWGFQFLWNPTTISTSVSRNMDITPSSADTLRVVAGVFPGQETVNLEIIIDRTNDFACIRATNAGNIKDYVRYYNSLYPGATTSQNMVQQITNLMAQGTMADLEYLFKAINGSGNGSLEWTNLLGKRTANVGYLAPTLLGIQLGPTLNNLSYVGWASNVNINHTAFTENMIPIRTEVGISIQCFAGSGLTSGV
jgi:hypothetical protein